MRIIVLLLIIAVFLPLSRHESPHTDISPTYFGYQGVLVKETTRLDEWKWYHPGDWIVAGASHGTTAGGEDYTELVFTRWSDSGLRHYNFRVMKYVGPDNNWDWPPDREFIFSWHTA